MQPFEKTSSEDDVIGRLLRSGVRRVCVLLPHFHVRLGFGLIWVAVYFLLLLRAAGFSGVECEARDFFNS